MKLKILKNKLLFCIVSALVVSALLSSLLLMGAMKSQSEKLSDALYSEQKPFSEITIIAIDDRSINEIGRWPWTRSVFAEGLEKLKDAKAIGVDVSFLEPESKEKDSMLQDKLDELSGKAILVSECSEFKEGKCSIWQKPIFNATTAAANVFLEDGVARAVPSAVDDMKSFSRAISEKYLNREIQLNDKNYIRFSRFDKISFSDLLSGKISAEKINEKIVLMGATAKNLHDEQETPIGVLSGIELHASAMQNAITGRFLERQSRTSEIIWMLALVLLAALALCYFRFITATITSLLLLIAYPVIAIFRFDAGVVYNLLYPMLTVILTYFAITGAYYLIEARQRKWISSVLGKYVSDSVAKEIMEKGEEALKLKGTKKTITILFADVRGFTAMSEKMNPERVVSILNRYLSRMTDIVFKHNGTLDKYVGDEIMATYNVPLDLKDHAIHAVKTAIDMQRASRKMGKELKYGIGINTGPAIVGNIGSKKRLDYTVIGDSVNLAARLCGKAEPDQIILSDSTYQLVKGKIKTRSLGEIQVKGKVKPIKVYEVVY